MNRTYEAFDESPLENIDYSELVNRGRREQAHAVRDAFIWLSSKLGGLLAAPTETPTEAPTNGACA